jgi:hypothetical protein
MMRCDDKIADEQQITVQIFEHTYGLSWSKFYENFALDRRETTFGNSLFPPFFSFFFVLRMPPSGGGDSEPRESPYSSVLHNNNSLAVSKAMKLFLI